MVASPAQNIERQTSGGHSTTTTRRSTQRPSHAGRSSSTTKQRRRGMIVARASDIPCAKRQPKPNTPMMTHPAMYVIFPPKRSARRPRKRKAWRVSRACEWPIRMSEGQLTFKIIASVADEVLEHRPRGVHLRAAVLLLRERILGLRRVGAFRRSCRHRGANVWTTETLSWAL